MLDVQTAEKSKCDATRQGQTTWHRPWTLRRRTWGYRQTEDSSESYLTSRLIKINSPACNPRVRRLFSRGSDYLNPKLDPVEKSVALGCYRLGDDVLLLYEPNPLDTWCQLACNPQVRRPCSRGSDYSNPKLDPVDKSVALGCYRLGYDILLLYEQNLLDNCSQLACNPQVRRLFLTGSDYFERSSLTLSKNASHLGFLAMSSK